jgi:hypothetical protein
MTSKKTIDAAVGSGYAIPQPTEDIEVAAGTPKQAVYMARWGRGRLGGTGALMVLGQRAEAQGRPVRWLDGDLKSGTLSAFYGDRCSRAPSEDAADFRDWIMGDLDDLMQDRQSRALDVSGGSSSMEELLRDMELPSFCAENDMRFTWLCPLGPNLEDFQHVQGAVDANHMQPRDMLLVLNEGVVRKNQNPAGAFIPLMENKGYLQLIEAGARMLYLPQNPVMDEIRQLGVSYYDILADCRDPITGKVKAARQHIVKRWLGALENGIAAQGTEDAIP